MDTWDIFAKKFESLVQPQETWQLGSSKQDIEAFAREVGVVFPQEFVEYLSVCDRPMVELCAPWTLLPFKVMKTNWEIQKDLATQGMTGEPTSDEDRDAGIKPDWYNLKWIPILDSGSGDFHCVDLDPAESGTVGQIISYFHDKQDRRVLAKNISDYFEKIMSEIEAGNLTSGDKEESQGLVAKEGSEASRMFAW